MHDTQTFFVFAGLVLVVIGFVSARSNLAGIRRALAASRWTNVDGQIEAAGVSEDDDYAGPNGSKRAIFRVVIRYSYRLGGQTYTSEKSGGDGRIFSSFGAARRAANQYATHEPIRVHVSPKDPRQSMIGVGAQWQWRYGFGLLAGVAFLALGVTLILARLGVRV